MEECGYTWHFWAVVAALASILFWIISRMYFGSKVEESMGRPMENVRMEDCKEATSMIVDYISRSLQNQGRGFTETSAGCDSLTVLRESKDVAKIIKEVHVCGGRLVLRKVSDSDIEDSRNTELEVKKKLTDLDIARAKRIKRKYKG